MRYLLLLLAACGANGQLSWSGLSSSSNGSSPSASHGGGGAAAYDAFAILGTKLGTPLENQTGFTCGPPRGTDGFTTQNHSCVKFLDERCQGRATKIHHIRSSADLPKGQSCFMDEFNGGTYLDRDFRAPPLLAVRIIGTDSDQPKIFELHYTFGADDLTPDTKLGKALIGKYGKPSYENPPTQMMWQRGEVKLSAACRGIGGDHADQGEFCEITVEDSSLDRAEREHQRERDEAARRRDAPAPPPI